MPKLFTRSVSLAPTFVDSEQQLAIYEEFRSGHSHISVKAYAGTAKTTTIIRAIPYAPESSIIVGAFGKANQEELEEKLIGTRAIAQTWHSVGYGAIREEWGYVKVADRSERADALALAVVGGLGKGVERLTAKLIIKAREILPLATTEEEIIDLAEEFDCVPARWEDISLGQLARAVLQAMTLAAEKPSACGIDYADMIFLPLRNNWLKPTFGMVIGDEAQDNTRAQILMMERVCAGRLVLVGDPFQSIYRFRGAEGDALDYAKNTLKAKEFPLSVTFRCPAAVVAVARRYVPDYEARAGAPAGVVDTLSGLDALVGAAQPKDFVLSRKNAPLMPIALRLLREGKPARVQGRDVAQGLIALIRRLSFGRPMATVEFLQKLREWGKQQTDRLYAAGKEHRIERVRDKVDTIVALSLDQPHTNALIVRLETLFADGAKTPQVVLSTVHKAKGLEADRVFVLKDTLFAAQPCRCNHFHEWGPCKRCPCKTHIAHPGREQEERNIAYVAITRSKSTLTWVEGVS